MKRRDVPGPQVLRPRVMTDTKTEDLKHVPPTEARQGQKVGRMRYVLSISVTLAVIALFVAWLVFW